MAHRSFFSFHFSYDHWRAGQVRNMGVVEGNTPISSNDWEAVKKQGDGAITRWISDNMKNRGSVIVLVGEQTASRPWVDYEIRKGWDDGKNVVGIRIHGLENSKGNTGTRGGNPFAKIKLTNGQMLSAYVVLHDPSGSNSKAVYATIKNNIEGWVDGAAKKSG